MRKCGTYVGHICFEVKIAFLWQIFRHPYRKILTLYVIYAKLLLYLNNYRNTGAKQIRKLSAEPNKESGAILGSAKKSL